MIDLSNTQLGQYQLTEVIRRGGMSTVYKAYQPSLDRYVAVKVLLHDRDPQFAARFKREARAIAQLQHHNILPIYDYGEQDNILFLVLQYIENGQTLGDMLGTPMAPLTALRLMNHVLSALDYAHARGIIHRDIKPANVLMPSPQWPMLADFGIAKLMNDNQQRLTVPGLIVGTAAYMAPEQATGQPIDARTDLYAAAVMLYEMLTGRVPFDADTPMVVLTKHVYEAPPPPRTVDPNIPVAVEVALLKGLAKDPAVRYQSAAEMAEELTRVASRLEQMHERSQLTSLYQAGVQAFEEGHWDLAVERFGQLVVFDPSYEDAAELLDAAREAQEQARLAARQQLDLVRQRRSTMHQQTRPPTESTPVSAAASPPTSARATSRLTPDELDLAPRPVVSSTPDGAVVPPAASSARRYAPWAVGAALIVVALALLLPRMIGGGIGAQPTSVPLAGGATSGPAGTAGPRPTSAAGPTAGSAASPAAATAAPNSAVPAPEPLGKLVYEDDFGAAQSEEAKSGLKDQKDVPNFSHGFHPPGVYHVKLSQPNDTRWVVLPRFLYGDFSIQVDLQDNSDDFGGDVAQGLIFRVRDDTHFYVALIDPRKGQYAVRKLDGKDTWNDLIPWKPSPLVKRKKEVNQLRVDAAGDTFTIYLNGALLDQFSEKSYGSGMVGMIVANVDANAPHMHFDNLKIWSNDPAPRDPGIPPVRNDPNGDMALIAGGEFILGSNETDEAQAQMFALPNFYIDRTEVTNEAYARCVAAGKCPPPTSAASANHPNYATEAQYAKFPVINVTWEDATAFCAWAGKRLPTEAEWEKAASWDAATRTKTIWPSGNLFDPKFLNSDEGKYLDTTAVGQFPEEINHTFDLGGNVSEWTNSLDKPYPYNESDGREDPQAPGNRIYRGGSWAQTEGKARSATRQSADPKTAFNEIGFRCAATP